MAGLHRAHRRAPTLDLPAGLPADLRRLREEAGLSQRAVAIAVGVTQTMVSRWERGACSPNTEHLARLAATLGVAVSRLLGQLADTATAMPPAAPRPQTLRELRKAAGLSQWQLAVRLGVNESAVSRWEAANRLPSPRYLARLAPLLGLPTVESLLATLAMRGAHRDREEQAADAVPPANAINPAASP